MAIDLNSLGAAAGLAVAVCVKDLFAYFKTKAKERSEKEDLRLNPPTYTPDEMWRKYCVDKFEDQSDTLHAIDKKIAEFAIRQDHIIDKQDEMADHLERIKIEHQTICVGKGTKNARY